MTIKTSESLNALAAGIDPLELFEEADAAFNDDDDDVDVLTRGIQIGFELAHVMKRFNRCEIYAVKPWVDADHVAYFVDRDEEAIMNRLDELTKELTE